MHIMHILMSPNQCINHSAPNVVIYKLGNRERYFLKVDDVRQPSIVPVSAYVRQGRHIVDTQSKHVLAKAGVCHPGTMPVNNVIMKHDAYL